MFIIANHTWYLGIAADLLLAGESESPEANYSIGD